jgi:hypothetical protein
MALYIDPYIAKSYEARGNFENDLMLDGLRLINQEFFRKAYIDYSVRFLARNPIRDTQKAYKALNMHDLQGTGAFKVSAKELGEEVVRSLPDAFKMAKGEINEKIKKLYDLKIIKRSPGIAELEDITEEDLDKASGIALELLKKKIVMRQNSKTEEKDGGWDLKEQASKYANLAKTIILIAGKTSENVTKIAAYNLIEKRLTQYGKNIDKVTASYIRRNIGTPNFYAGGTWTPYTNVFFMFSRVAIQGWRSTYDLMVDPNTRSGYAARSVQLAVLPKILLFLAWSGLLGDWLKDYVRKESEYKLKHYIMVPTFLEDKYGKGIWLNIPLDFDTQVLSAFTWMIMTQTWNKFKENEDYRQSEFVREIFNVMPGLTNTIALPITWAMYFAGFNPRDNYRNEPIIYEDEFSAGGKYALTQMLKHTWNETLGGILGRMSMRENNKQTSLIQKISLHTPVINAFFDVTDYGVYEEATKLGEAAEKEASITRLEKRSVIINKVDKYLAKQGNLDELFKELLIEE